MTEIISENQIYMQDVICSAVLENPNANDFAIYNQVVKYVDVSDMKTVAKILDLIRINKLMLSNIE